MSSKSFQMNMLKDRSFVHISATNCKQKKSFWIPIEEEL